MHHFLSKLLLIFRSILDISKIKFIQIYLIKIIVTIRIYKGGLLFYRINIYYNQFNNIEINQNLMSSLKFFYINIQRKFQLNFFIFCFNILEKNYRKKQKNLEIICKKNEIECYRCIFANFHPT